MIEQSMERKILQKFQDIILPYQLGFVVGHDYLSEQQIQRIRRCLEFERSTSIVAEYENRLAKMIGPGHGLSFSAGRMAFYCLLKSLNVGPGDEVILPGFTCSVMPNAVYRTGATPIYSNVDPETFGSSPLAIEEKITAHTKAIVAQHSFGIPCKIKEIVELAASKGIFVIEDSAITLGSTVDGIATGNFGHAAIFSTDHSKPLNTLIGGFLYSRDREIIQNVKANFASLPELDTPHQKRLFNQLMFERKWLSPRRYPRSKLRNLTNLVMQKVKKTEKWTFLEGEYTRISSPDASYPYPSRIPSFLAQVGLFEIERWNNEKDRRRKILQEYLDVAKNSPMSNCVSDVYKDPSLDIVPLRFVYRHPNPEKHRKLISRYIDVGWTWFRAPIICCAKGIEDFGYVNGDCGLSEDVGSDIINWPCVVSEGWEKKLIKIFGIVNSRSMK